MEEFDCFHFELKIIFFGDKDKDCCANFKNQLTIQFRSLFYLKTINNYLNINRKKP